jgi:phenylpropionate dioxygenase-like ring-hydroxylating dioxygenase large terminal subunit
MTLKVVNHTDIDVSITNYSKHRYLSKDYMEQEWSEVWRKQWLVAGLESDVERTGQFFVFDLGREQILVTRMTDGAVQGFYNVCQHRGNRLVTEHCGQTNSFRCAYHAWTYDLDGRLKAVPYENRFTDGLNRDELQLKQVKTTCWNGLVFINMDPECDSLESFLDEIITHLAPYQFDRMTLVEDQTVQLECNWKAVMDNFGELYHVDFLHPQHKRMVDCCNDTVHLFKHGHTGLSVPGGTVSSRFPIPDEPTDLQSMQLKSLGLDPSDFHGRVMDVRIAIQKRKREVGAEMGMHYESFNEDQLSDVWQYNLFPNTILSFTPEHCWVLRPRPHPTDPRRCEFDKMSLVMFADPALGGSAKPVNSPGRMATTAQKPADYSRPEVDVFDYSLVIDKQKTMTDTIDQDVELLGNVQAGMQSAGFDRVFLNDDELRVQHFHHQMDRMVSPNS